MPHLIDGSDARNTAGSTFERVAIDLQHRAFRELAAVLGERRHRILSRWRVLSLKAMPNLDRITAEEFKDAIATILDAVIEAIGSEDPQQLRGIIEQAPSHGLVRFIQSIGLMDYFEEQRILRGVIVIEVTEGLKRPLEIGEAATLHALFDIIVQQGAMALVQKQKELAQQTERELQETQRFLRSSLDALSGSIAILDADGMILEVNESWRRFAGENKFVGSSWGVGANYFLPCENAVENAGDVTADGASGIAQGIREVIARRRDNFEIEYPCHSPTEQRWFLMRVTRFQGSGPIRVVVMHDNVTERKQAEVARREMADRFAEHSRVFDRLLSSIADFAYTFDLNGRFTFANKPLLDLLGQTLEQIIGKNFSDLQYPAELAEKLQRQIQEVIGTGQPVVGETPFTNSTGNTGHYQYIFSPVTGLNGRVEAVAGSTRDVTAQKRVEEELRLSVLDRERLLSAERVARADAEAASRAKDRFLAVLSHELRTPLTPVVMTATALEMDPDHSADVREAAEMIRRNVELEVKLIDDLLDISRITTGKLSLQSDRLDINDLLRHVCEMCRSNINEKNVRLHHVLDADVNQVMGDSGRLHQVFWNVLSNATKFTPSGGRIEVTTHNIEGTGVRVKIRDTGIGIPPGILPHIFNAFEQGDERITRQFGGLGLGLAISKLLVEAHSGSIRAEANDPDGGSTFIVDLPTVAKAEAVERPLDSAPPAIRDNTPLRVLIVEDHPDTVRVLNRILTASGYAVMTAGTVAAALSLVNQHCFDLVLSDLGLPDATGYELMKQIKQIYAGNGASVKGVAMSGFGMEEDIRKSEEAGFSHHLVKPVSLARLEQTIRMVTASG